MNTLALVPYCPWPPDTGTRVEMLKHLEVLKGLGQCTIISARKKPVGFGWSDDAIAEMQLRGFSVEFRESGCSVSFPNILGIVYASVFKGLGMERAFGHSNPYHRLAFSKNWLYRLSKGYDLCVMQYGFWAGFPLQCPKAVVVHELLSNYHWEGSARETKDFATADLVVVVGRDEEILLRSRGVKSVLWSPPAVKSVDYPACSKVGLIGTKAPQNIEGLRWLEKANPPESFKIHVYGSLAQETKKAMFVPEGRYERQGEPYENCGVLLLTRPDRPGLQIKAVEALAYGRVIVARRGSMRGLPEGDDAWITVDSPREMIEVAAGLQNDHQKIELLALKAKAYYKKYLDNELILDSLRAAFTSLVK